MKKSIHDSNKRNGKIQTEFFSKKLGQVKDDLVQPNYLHQIILDSINDGIFTIDQDGKIQIWNRAAEQMSGFTKEEVLFLSMHEHIHHTNVKGEPCIKEFCPITMSLKDGTSISVDYDIFWRKDGTSYVVEFQTNPIVKNGEYVGLVVTFRDITKRIETEKLLREGEKLSAVGEFAAGIAHEIRNPLTSLKGFLYLIQSGKEAKVDYFEIMNSEFDRIEQILKELLVLAKPQSTTLQVHILEEILENVILLLETQSILKNISIVRQFQHNRTQLSCVENQMKQVFINIIKNAIEATDQGGTIIVTTKLHNETVEIIVKDEGCGMSKETLAKLSEPFYTTKETGTGLGLLVTYNIVEEHGGKIHVDSKVGIGTTFTITLPIINSKL